ncbi:hypothetical protein FB567DRAFT_253290 [Paraphoma chrysanthemicola]|uniref:Heterokaryon incompatibility domain-containing protein n=1 Tax=Paraphoma chrysanthemicola TaxID=798071 RepID=A0A8K0QTK5_9PLEO|nr:hypothetical protein FB567DRAFT_253290 [Paraphoma chrysanthemicola]
MADVYSSAHLILAAINTSDCNDGFIHPRPDTVVIKSNGAPAVHVRRAVCHHTREKTFQMEPYPLFKRVWCMQERELACRTLHFLPDEVVWQCAALTDCECGANPERDVPSEHSGAIRRYACFKSSAMEDTTIGKVWAAIVEDYCRLGITYASDTLPALSGLAQRLEVLEPGRYIAGLWETDLAFLLNWSPQTEYGTIFPRAEINGPIFS